MHAAVLLLGRTFDLEERFNGHQFVEIVQLIHLTRYIEFKALNDAEGAVSCSMAKEDYNQPQSPNIGSRLHQGGPPLC